MLASHYYEGKVEAGCDEAGRGCLAGSVYAAAVIFPENYQNEELNDSKQLTDKRRKQLREIIERDAVAWAVGIVTPEEIDKINILNASILAMHRALDQLKVRPEAIIVDGNRFKPYQKLLTPPSSKAMANISLLQRPVSLPRPIVMIIWTLWQKSIRNMTGSPTKAILPKSIEMPSANMV